ncbi:hypothetical protein AVEN_232047-1 [Araneus ventricosus]|uniref:Uncharacterized protein n=1 Tax=Araneus ventricosus TaxID=182803 RepID=A0A4Y2EK91_ARAVE|nr:hypothetical protein AVEN_232047-1 [Araneus ventricosus]
MKKAVEEEELLTGSSDIMVSGDGTWKTRSHSFLVGNMWEKYKNNMVDDIFHRLKGSNENIKYNDEINNEVLNKVEDQVITITGKDLSSFGMNRPLGIEEVSNDLTQELDYGTEELQHD